MFGSFSVEHRNGFAFPPVSARLPLVPHLIHLFVLAHTLSALHHLHCQVSVL